MTTGAPPDLIWPNGTPHACKCGVSVFDVQIIQTGRIVPVEVVIDQARGRLLVDPSTDPPRALLIDGEKARISADNAVALYRVHRCARAPQRPRRRRRR